MSDSTAFSISDAVEPTANDADLLEQQLPVEADAAATPATPLDPEVPLADAWEQALPTGEVDDEPPRSPVRDDVEVPLEDAWEQSQPVVDVDDRDY